jgi:hypothetical protein
MSLKEQVEQLQQKLERLRGALVRAPQSGLLAEVDQARWEASHLREQAEGTDFVPALDSIVTLLDCLRRGVEAQTQLNGLRHAG